jgi:hypothetical protein
VSRADVETCVQAFRHPCHFPFPGNPGFWISEGVFQHNSGELCFTEKYVAENPQRFGFKQGHLRQTHNTRKLDVLRVTWPGTGCGGWSRVIYSAPSLLRLSKLRADPTPAEGEWIEQDDIWHDADGLWYSSRYIARKMEQPVARMHSLLRGSGLIARFKSIPRRGRGPVVVHHQDEAHPVLGLRVWPPQRRERDINRAGSDQECTDQQTPGATQAPDWAEAAAHPKKPHGGRQRSELSDLVQRFCYENLRKHKRILIVSQAKEKFGSAAPKSPPHVTTYARRYAEAHHLRYPPLL